MIKEQLVHSLSTHACILNPEIVADSIEDALKDLNLDLSNLTTYFVYNRDNEVDISLMTNPSHNIHVKIEKRPTSD